MPTFVEVPVWILVVAVLVAAIIITVRRHARDD